MDSPMTPITGCRSCGGTDLLTLLELGTLPLANCLLEDRSDVAPAFPLTVVFCSQCALVQIVETVRPDILFSHYLYLSSFSDSMLAHAKAVCEELRVRMALSHESLVVEVASNDGYLLKNFVEVGVPVLGIEPARNIADQANSAGVPTRCAFFTERLSKELQNEGLRATVVIGNNVLAHVADLNDFVSGLANVLRPGGCVVVEVPYVRQLVEETQFDTIYHEHLCYYSLHSLQSLFARHDLEIWDVRRLPIHGGSLRIYAQRSGEPRAAEPAVAEILAQEATIGMRSYEFYQGFADRVEHLLGEVRSEIARRKTAGQRLAAYGASAKGSTLMNAAGIGPEEIDFVVDRSTVKQGMFTPGNGLPIVSPARLLQEQPDAVLLLTWNFADEIVGQQHEYLRRGGAFIVPVPAVETVEAESSRDD